MSITYAVMAVMAIILLVGYILLVKEKELWLFLLYLCVSIINTGYFLLSISKTLEQAILANDLAYLGSVFISMCMLLTIVKLCGFKLEKGLVISLAVIGALMFGVVATSGILPWYYEEVSLIFVDGATKLEKVYGVLHPLYMIYLIGYFTAMVVCIIQSIKLKMIASQKHATLMAAIVFGNIAVWLVEKFIPWDFEFLSVSYLFSEVIFLGLYWMMQDYVRTDLLPEQEIVIEIKNSDMPIEEKTDMVISMLNPKEPLSAREREILGYVILNKRRREIAEQMYLSENTVKSYTRTLYTKLGVSSREEILDLIK